ncbi:MAG TPA: D-arabinono-1,4-lactone oxidase [Anaerolineales bacterium]|nr:D-arabinono-1,4-lactone oxidase [Anaerolineales bacterium]
MSNKTLTNWAGNLAYGATTLLRPRSIPELQEMVRANPRLKVLGTRHSFSAIADTNAAHLSLDRLPTEITIGPDRRSVTVTGHLTYAALARTLQRKGLGLHNLASLPHISIAGAVQTATHGSGRRNGSLAVPVSALELVTASGEIRRLSRAADGGRFDGAVVGLGALGVVTALTLDVVSTFDVRQFVYPGLPPADIPAVVEDLIGLAYSVSVFTDWVHLEKTLLWVKDRVADGRFADPPREIAGAQLAEEELHPIAGLPAEACTPQLGRIGPWHERLPHFRMEFQPSAGEELQSEYFVPFERAGGALEALLAIGERIAPLLWVSEIRAIAADAHWMSPCYGRDSLAVHFTWKPDWEAVRGVLPRIEAALEPFGARPHWGKLFTMAPDAVREGYARLGDFVQLAGELDPGGKFRNGFLDHFIFEAR